MSSTVHAASTGVHSTSGTASPVPGTKRHRRAALIGILVVAVGVTLWVTMRPAGMLRGLIGGAPDTSMYYVVQPVTLHVTLKEDGSLVPVNSVELKCEVQGQGFAGLTIQSVVDESTHVKEGDLLIELTSDDLKDRVETEEMELRKLTAGLEDAEQALTITRSDNATQIRKADIALEVAQLELQRYLEGDYEKSKASIRISIKQTKMEIERTTDELEKSRPLEEKGFVTRSKIEELEDELERLEMTLAKHELEMLILDEYELKKNKMQKTAAVESARDELDRERQRAASREKQALARVEDQSQSLAIRKRRFDRMKAQLDSCRIVAPVEGIVQYGESNERRRWSSNRIAPGEQVHPGQTLLTIPDTSQMKVSTRIHEADRHRVHEGMSCLVKVPAVPGETFSGKLVKIAKFADSERSWWNPELKEHATEILLDGNHPALSPGDTAHIEILIEELHDVLTVPVQCVFTRGSRHFVFVRDGRSAEPVEVEIGAANTTAVEVTKGLSKAKQVVMAPDERLLAMLPATAAGQPEKTPPARSARSTRR